MALETLNGVKEVRGVKIEELRDFADKRPDEFIVVNHKNNGINFKIQDGPIKEVGVNGCQLDALIAIADHMIKGLNDKFPCIENANAREHLQSALFWLDERKAQRERRGVEGYSKQ